MEAGLRREGFAMETLLGNGEWSIVKFGYLMPLLGNGEWSIVNGEIWTSNAVVGLPSNGPWKHDCAGRGL